MEFGTGHDVQPGDDITMESSSGDQNLGQATYDSDHDGIADSVVIIQGDHQYLITDADQDGYADSVRAFDASGHEIDPHTGDRVDEEPGSGSDGTPTGSNVLGGTVAGSTAGGSTAGGTADVGSSWFGAAAAAVPAPVAGAAGDGMSTLGPDGTEQHLGGPTVDLDRDGTADTAVVREPDGAVVGYTDRDGDGIADQMTRIGPDGAVEISVGDGAGGWEVAATGHLDDAGVLVEDQLPQAR